MKMSSIIKTGFVVCAGVLIVIAVQAATENTVDTMTKAAKSEVDAVTKEAVRDYTMKDMKGCTMKDMHGCVAECMKNCDKNMTDMSAAMTALDEATKAIDAGDTVAAKVEIEKAQTLLKGIQDAQKKCMEKMPVINAQCPISGKQIEMMNVPANRTTMYKGQKIGFCSPACPAAWKMLPDTEKDAKLKTSMFKDIEQETMKKKVENYIP
jgi:hypothetical protein